MGLVNITGYGKGNNPALKALKSAIVDLSFGYNLINKISGAILIHFVIHPDFLMMDLAEALEIIYENAHDESVSPKYVKANILFIGFDKNDYNNVANN